VEQLFLAREQLGRWDCTFSWCYRRQYCSNLMDVDATGCSSRKPRRSQTRDHETRRRAPYIEARRQNNRTIELSRTRRVYRVQRQEVGWFPDAGSGEPQGRAIYQAVLRHANSCAHEKADAIPLNTRTIGHPGSSHRVMERRLVPAWARARGRRTIIRGMLTRTIRPPLLFRRGGQDTSEPTRAVEN
jgi:hypothetical protein